MEWKYKPIKESKEQRVLRKQRESVAMENAQRKIIGQPSSSTQTADRKLYDRPVNKDAKNVID